MIHSCIVFPLMNREKRPKELDCFKYNWYIAKKLSVCGPGKVGVLLCREVIVFASKTVLSPGVEEIMLSVSVRKTFKL